jgi:hypothetical protein
MAWENRPRGGRYYVRKQRINGKMVSEYIGTGESALLVAQMDKLARLEAAIRLAEQSAPVPAHTKCLATDLKSTPPVIAFVRSGNSRRGTINSV